MKSQIWRVLTQILWNRPNLVNTIEPFLENLNNDNINNDKFKSVLQTFPLNQLEVLYNYKIISKAKFYSILSENEKKYELSLDFSRDNSKIDEIILGDKVNELQKLIEENGIDKISTIITPFQEVKTMIIPLIQYCILKNAIECFKYLLNNSLDDPIKLMEEQNPKKYMDPNTHQWKDKRIYEWDCMATAIYTGNNDIMEALEKRGIQKGINSVHIEAAILSYRNAIVKEILNDTNEKDDFEYILDNSILVSAKNNNIKAAELLFKYGCDINTQDQQLNLFQKIEHHFILH